ncbi:MAG: DUF951 domain-containing protein [Ignavibacteriales bacterium]
MPENLAKGVINLEAKKYELGDTVRMKKKHPCGSWEWVVTRMGADIKVKCSGCGHQVMMTRADFDKRMVAVVKSQE